MLSITSTKEPIYESSDKGGGNALAGITATVVAGVEDKRHVEQGLSHSALPIFLNVIEGSVKVSDREVADSREHIPRRWFLLLCGGVGWFLDFRGVHWKRFKLNERLLTHCSVEIPILR